MKALLSLNESTVEEIIVDLIGVPEDHAAYMAKNMRLSEILDMIHELKGNNVDEATNILEPYLAELHSGSATKTAAQNQSQSTTKPIGTIKSKRPNITGPELDQNNEPIELTHTITDKFGRTIAQTSSDASDAIRSIRTQAQGTGKGRAIRSIKGLVNS